MSRKRIPYPYSIFHLQKTYSMSTQHIPSPKDIQHVHTAHTMSPEHTYLSPEHTYRLHRHHRGSGPQKCKILTFSQICPVTFGLCLGIITDTFHWVFELLKISFSIFSYFLLFFDSNNPNNPSNIIKNWGRLFCSFWRFQL